MELFHQTVSMKAVANLNEFVRNHMLEPFDSASWVNTLITHFENLTRSHEAVLKARAQLAELDPAAGDCDTYDVLDAQVAALTEQRAALRFYLAVRQAELLARQAEHLEIERVAEDAKLGTVDRQIDELRARKERLALERAGHGGDRLAEIESQIGSQQILADDRERVQRRFADQLVECGLRSVESQEQFAQRQTEIAQASEAASQEVADCQNQSAEISVELANIRTESDELRAELASLQQRRSNIPRESLALRTQLCRALDVDEADLPFAGELIAVRAEHAEWEGAAERVLHSFALSMLVPDRHYAAASGWINDHHLGRRLVYYRVLPTQGTPSRLGVDSGVLPLYAVLEIKEPSTFYRWLEESCSNGPTMPVSTRCRNSVGPGPL